MSSLGRILVCSGVLGACALTSANASDEPGSDPVVSAIMHRDCTKAVSALNSVADAPDAKHAYTLFVGGRMLAEGICTVKDPAQASAYFERSASYGDLNATLEYGTEIGLGVGASQDYASAGKECREGGLDVGGSVSAYSLGYACTVRGMAGRLLRASLPKGAFRLPTEPAVVEFNPATSKFKIVSAPAAAKFADAPSGSLIAPAVVNPTQVITRAWKKAESSVPKPDKQNLTSEVIRMSLDIDATLEGGALAEPPPNLLPSDLLTSNPHVIPTGSSGPTAH